MAEEPKIKGESESVAFTPEQLDTVNKMIANAVRSSSQTASGTGALSVYNLRDPKAIETVKVSRIDGMFVVGFKNMQKDPMKTEPLYITYQTNPLSTRQKLDAPFITLILSSDGKKMKEKEMLISDYYDKREQYQAKVLEMKRTKVVEDHGTLGHSASMAVAIDSDGKPMQRPTILAQSQREDIIFLVELPGFDEPVTFTSDLKGPLA